jgi:lipopolysaccharide heptosyltransferase II
MKSNSEIPFLQAYNRKKLKTGFLIDRVLRKLFLGKNKHPVYRGIPRRILVIQSHLIGDLMMAIPVLKALKRRYPGAEVSLLANEFAQELFSGAWYLDKIYIAPFPWGIRKYSAANLWTLLSMIMRLRRIGFDLAIDSQIDFRNAFILFLIGAKRRLGYDIVGGRTFLTDVPEFPREVVHLLEGRLSVLRYLDIDTSDKSYELPLNTESQLWVESFMKENDLLGKDIVAVHPGASVPEKFWSADRFATVIEGLYSRALVPVLVEGPDDGPIADDICSKTGRNILRLKATLPNVITFFSTCRLVLCLDSAASHFASAVKTPAVVLYGPQRPALSKPFDDNIVAVWNKDIGCRPCVYADRRQCMGGANVCMNRIEPESVLSAVDKLLERTTAAKKRTTEIRHDEV